MEEIIDCHVQEGLLDLLECTCSTGSTSRQYSSTIYYDEWC